MGGTIQEIAAVMEKKRKKLVEVVHCTEGEIHLGGGATQVIPFGVISLFFAGIFFFNFQCIH